MSLQALISLWQNGITKIKSYHLIEVDHLTESFSKWWFQALTDERIFNSHLSVYEYQLKCLIV